MEDGLDSDDGEIDIRDSLCAPLGSLILGQELRSNRHSFSSYRSSLSPATPRLAREASGGAATPSSQRYSFWYGQSKHGPRTTVGVGDAETGAEAEAEAEEVRRAYEKIFHVRELRCLEGLVPGVCLELESYAQAELEFFDEDDLPEEMRAAYESGVQMEGGAKTVDARDSGGGSGYRKKSFVERPFRRSDQAVLDSPHEGTSGKSELDVEAQGESREAVARTGGHESEAGLESETTRRGSLASAAGSGQGSPSGGSLQRRTPMAKAQARKQSAAMVQAEAVAQARSKAEAGSQGATQALVRPHTEAGAETPTDANAEASIEAIAKTETETEAQWEMEQDSPRKHMLSKETDGPAVVTSASPFLADSGTSFAGSMRLEEMYDTPTSQRGGTINPTPDYKGPAEQAILNEAKQEAMQLSSIDDVVNPAPDYIGAAERERLEALEMHDNITLRRKESFSTQASPSSPASLSQSPEAALPLPASPGATSLTFSAQTPLPGDQSGVTTRPKRGTKSVLTRWQSNMANNPNPPVPSYLRRRSATGINKGGGIDGDGVGIASGGGGGGNERSGGNERGGDEITARQTVRPNLRLDSPPPAPPTDMRGEDTFSNFPLSASGRFSSTPSQGRTRGVGMRTPDGPVARVMATPGSRRSGTGESSPTTRLWTPRQPTAQPAARASTPMRKSRRRIDGTGDEKGEEGREDGSKIEVRRYSTKKIVRERWKHAEKAETAEPPAFFRRSTTRGW